MSKIDEKHFDTYLLTSHMRCGLIRLKCLLIADDDVHYSSGSNVEFIMAFYLFESFQITTSTHCSEIH